MPPQPLTEFAPPRLLTRRSACGAFAAGLAAAAAPRAGAEAQVARRLQLRNIHTLESLDVEYWRDGAYSAQGLAQVNQVLRDHRDGAVHPIDPQLLDLLHEVARLCECAPVFEVISGYRSPASNAAMHARSNGVAAHSLHVEGRAIDVR